MRTVKALALTVAAASAAQARSFDPVPTGAHARAADRLAAPKPPPLQIAPMEPIKMVLLVGELPAATSFHGIDALLDRAPDAEDLP